MNWLKERVESRGETITMNNMKSLKSATPSSLFDKFCA